MYSDDKSTAVFSAGSLTAVGEVMVILFLIFFPTGMAETFLREQGFSSQPPSPATEQQVAASVHVGPGRSLLVDGKKTHPDLLAASLGEIPPGGVVELQTYTPVDYQFHYRVRYTLRSHRWSLRELPPIARQGSTN
jgi:hypothetical protein